MIWSEVVKEYGEELAEKMKNSQYLRGITCEITDDGEVDIPAQDIYLAYKDVTGKTIYTGEWD